MALVDVDREQAEARADQIRAQGRRAVALHADVTLTGQTLVVDGGSSTANPFGLSSR